MGMVLIDAQLL